MSDQPTPGEQAVPVCPWCSAALTAADTETCPSCGAKLQGEGDQPLPGLTAIDPLAVIEGARPPQRPRNRIVAWLTGGDIEEGTQQPPSPEALAPPPPEVRREMLRLQMEAELSQLSAEAEAMVSDEAIAAEDEGDAARARAAMATVLGLDAATDAANQAAEAAAAEAAADAIAAADGDEQPASPADDAESSIGGATTAD